MLVKSRSRIVIAAMDSTTTTARGTMTGSWRPLMIISVFSPSLVTVDCGCEMDGVGFTAARKMILLPSLIPPRTPPAWLVSLVILPSFVWKESLLILPFVSAALKPSPISKPLTAPMDSIALARLASSFSNTVSPIPTGIPVTTHSMMPPEESWFLIHSSR